MVDIDLTENFSLLQVKYVFEAFKKLRPGIPLMCLYGRMKQERRMGIYAQFCEKRSVLFCTDVASRGLDFNKAVDWVVQVKYWLFKEATFALGRKSVLKLAHRHCFVILGRLPRRCCILHSSSWAHCPL